MRIGVFDSGVGGLSVASAIREALPAHEVILREDKANLPYGTKTPEQLFELVMPILEQMASEGCEVIVIACNTVTTNIIQDLRETLQVPLIGMEPMVKPAAEQTKTGTIGVCATPATLKSKRYNWLKQEYCKNVAVIEPDCSGWAQMVEAQRVDREQIRQSVDLMLEGGADVIVLGCTHYHWIEELINVLVDGRAQVIQPEGPVIAQLKRVIEQLD